MTIFRKYYYRYRRKWRDFAGKHPLQSWRRRLAYVLTKWLLALILRIPEKASLALGSFLGVAAYWLAPKYRARTLRNLAMALGETLAEDERKAIARRTFANFGRNFAELAVARKWTKEDFNRRVHSFGLENMQGELNQGRGVIIMTAHYGCWELAASTLLRLGVPLAAVAQPFSNERLNEILNRTRLESGLKVISRGESAAAAYRHIKEGGALAVVGDQDTHRGSGCFVDFFGRPAYTQYGPARIAHKLNVPIVPLFISRNDDGFTHTILCEEPIWPPRDMSKDEAVVWMVQRYTNAIEAAIRRRPAEWIWFHRRWRELSHAPDDAVRDFRQRRAAAVAAGGGADGVGLRQ